LCAPAHPQDLAGAISGLQRRYASAETVSGNFQQTYRAPGIDQAQSGVFWLKKPGLMRWEYRSPEEQLFVADGRESFLYVPRDRQVTVQPLTASDLRRTPLEFLMGAGDIPKSFVSSWDTEFAPKADRTVLIRLTPRAKDPAYLFLVLELDQTTFDLRRIVVREPTGNTMEFLLSGVAINRKLEPKLFQFKPPKGTEIMRLDE
jgi:outer membrane lipoprotein carrier protein